MLGCNDSGLESEGEPLADQHVPSGPPLLVQINARVWLRSASHRLGRPATLDDFDDGRIERLAGQGFGWIWLLGVWRTGEIGRAIARALPELRAAYRLALPDVAEEDVCGSCFAVAGYEVDPAMGGEAALLRLRSRMHRHGVRLMLDFVPNHTARDHSWVRERPQLYRRGSAADLAREPGNFLHIETGEGPLILAHGRDPNFPGWSDTLQLDYANPATHGAMSEELLRVAGLCDGLRCDMAMLLLPEVFRRTWGASAPPFWPEAIARVRRLHPGFLFLAEAYWELEWELLGQGFDHAYDKRLYDRLRAGQAEPIRAHLRADPAFQAHLARFLENHDEERAATVFPQARHRAAAIITYLAPGLKFFQEGQLEGHRVRLPAQLCRAPEELEDPPIARFYAWLLAALRSPLIGSGSWRLREEDCEGALIAFDWTGEDARLIVAVNYADSSSRLRVRLAEHEVSGGSIRISDPADGSVLEGSGAEPAPEGLALDLPGWGARLIEVSRRLP